VNRLSTSLALLGLPAVLVAGRVARAQSPPTPPSFPSTVELVTVDAVVLDKNGRAVPFLTRDDFVLAEDREAQPIVSFEAFHLEAEPEPERPAPAAVASNEPRGGHAGRAFAILVDDVGLAAERTEAARSAVVAFLERSLRDGDGIALGTTSGIWWSGVVPEVREDLLAVLARVQGLRVEAPALDHMTDYEAFWIRNYEDSPAAERVGPGASSGLVVGGATSSLPAPAPGGMGSLRRRVKLRWEERRLCVPSPARDLACVDPPPHGPPRARKGGPVASTARAGGAPQLRRGRRAVLRVRGLRRRPPPRRRHASGLGRRRAVDERRPPGVRPGADPDRRGPRRSSRPAGGHAPGGRGGGSLGPGVRRPRRAERRPAQASRVFSYLRVVSGTTEGSMRSRGRGLIVVKLLLLAVLLLALNGVGSRFLPPAQGPPAEQAASPAPASSLLGLVFAILLLQTLALAYPVLRSRLYGWRLVFTMALLYFGTVTFMSQVESLVYLRQKMPEGMLAGLFAMGLFNAVVFAPVLVSVLGAWRPRAPETRAPASSGRAQGSPGAWLWRALVGAAVYLALYYAFGYFVAWRNPVVRDYYGGTDPGSFLAQVASLARETPWMMPLQFARGLLWVGLALLVVRTMRGAWWEAGLATALLFAVPSLYLLLPNPLMPEAVRIAHLVKTTPYQFAFGWFVAWLFRVTPR
jgi:hypothetical protein